MQQGFSRKKPSFVYDLSCNLWTPGRVKDESKECIQYNYKVRTSEPFSVSFYSTAFVALSIFRILHGAGLS